MKYNYKGEQVKLHGIFQYAYVIEQSLMIGGHGGGQIAYPVAVIQFKNGEFMNVQPQELKAWSDEDE